MELRRYPALKAAGLVSLARDGDGFVGTLAQHDAITAQPIAPQRIPFTQAQVEHAIEQHQSAIAASQAEIVGLQALLADMDAL